MGPADDDADGPGATIGRYQVVGRLGAGGMGVVLLAIDPTLGRKVALKLLHQDTDEHAEVARRRLLREAQGTAQLSHDNVVTVHEVGTHQGRVYLAMEYVAGRTLGGWQAGRSWREIVAMYARAGQGLLAAHAAGLVHRDFKPDNVLIGDDGRVRVTDFGLVAPALADDGDGDGDGGARPADSAAMRREHLELAVSMTRTGSIMGTPRYMAPEQHLGLAVDARADQFAFCVALYEALYGQPPFPAESYPVLVASVLAGEVAPVPADSEVPAAVRALVLRGLARDHRARHPSMRELIDGLAAAAARPAGRRGWWIAGGLTVALAAVAAVAIGPRGRAPATVAARAPDGGAGATIGGGARADVDGGGARADVDGGGARAATDAAVSAPPDDVAAWIAMLEDHGAAAAARREAVRALAASADERAAVALLRAAKRDPDPAIRAAARASVARYLDVIASLGPRPPARPSPRGGGGGRPHGLDTDSALEPDDPGGHGLGADAPPPSPAPPGAPPSPSPAAAEPPWARGVSEDRRARATRELSAANRALADGDVARAQAGYRRALAAWDHPAIHYNLALALLATDDGAAAAGELRAALRYPAALGSAHGERARALLAGLSAAP